MTTPSKTLVIGASENPARYSYRAIKLLREYDEPVEAIGLRPGQVADVPFKTSWEDIVAAGPYATVTLYVGPKNQPDYYDKVLALAPKRVIFNPGTENPAFMTRLREAGIHVEIACTLVMLRSNQYAM